ncbi:MAG: hypothetical protein BA861_11930 [Desulfobacterales bacterium S3730MH5]|nr:MAG: hypothetical protein BA861_11930 [Desulfobacterales bacterium S3730MH5]OEU78970.1 MAG: hypothetical protein BA873_03800 [Desulfobulbaceae bacterium C00003063]OEU82048.1 MAG: hypothetical protein BA865_03240 [Desulfobacterales bacterium S5133MH4]
MTNSDPRSNESSVTARLIELFNNLSQAQQQALLSILEDWQPADRRKHPRKPCLLSVDYATGDRVFKDFIKNIAADGVFIETRTAFSFGQEITMTFSCSSYKEPIKIKGNILWSNPLGIGVKFDAENQAVIDMIKTL